VSSLWLLRPPPSTLFPYTTLFRSVRDEHDDREAPASQQVGTDSWLVSGQLRADEVTGVTGFRMPDGDYETIAGLILERLGKIPRSEEHTSELQSLAYLVCRLLLEK